MGDEQVHHPGDLRGVTARGGAGLEVEGQGVGVVGLEHAGRRERPPRQVGAGLQRLVGTVGGGLQVEPLHGDGAGRAHRGGLPAGGEELGVGGLEVGDAGADLLRPHQHDVGAVRHEVRQGHHLLIDERRDQCLHTVRRDAVGDLAEQLDEGGVAQYLVESRRGSRRRL